MERDESKFAQFRRSEIPRRLRGSG